VFRQEILMDLIRKEKMMYFRNMMQALRAHKAFAPIALVGTLAGMFLLCILLLSADQSKNAARWFLSGLGRTIFSNPVVNFAYLILTLVLLSSTIRKLVRTAAELILRRLEHSGGKIKLGGIGLELPPGSRQHANPAQVSGSSAGYECPDGAIAYTMTRRHYEYYRTYSRKVLKKNATGTCDEDVTSAKQMLGAIRNLKSLQLLRYKLHDHVFVGHRLVGTTVIEGTQFYDVEIFLRDGGKNRSRRVKKVEYYLGEGWNDQLYISRNPSTRFGIRVSAWGEFIVAARIHYWPEEDGGCSEAVDTWRYVDFFGNAATSQVNSNRSGKTQS
jgi:hypothetical protein